MYLLFKYVRNNEAFLRSELVELVVAPDQTKVKNHQKTGPEDQLDGEHLGPQNSRKKSAPQRSNPGINTTELNDFATLKKSRFYQKFENQHYTRKGKIHRKRRKNPTKFAQLSVHNELEDLEAKVWKNFKIFAFIHFLGMVGVSYLMNALISGIRGYLTQKPFRYMIVPILINISFSVSMALSAALLLCYNYSRGDRPPSPPPTEPKKPSRLNQVADNQERQKTKKEQNEESQANKIDKLLAKSHFSYLFGPKKLLILSMVKISPSIQIYCSFYAGYITNSMGLKGIVILCSGYPLVMGAIQKLTSYMNSRFELKFDLLIETYSLLFASIPYKLKFLGVKKSSLAFLILFIKGIFKVIAYILLPCYRNSEKPIESEILDDEVGKKLDLVVDNAEVVADPNKMGTKGRGRLEQIDLAEGGRRRRMSDLGMFMGVGRHSLRSGNGKNGDGVGEGLSGDGHNDQNRLEEGKIGLWGSPGNGYLSERSLKKGGVLNNSPGQKKNRFRMNPFKKLIGTPSSSVKS